MALLTDTDLKEIICTERGKGDENKLYINPYSEDFLTPVGYDLRVGKSYLSTSKAHVVKLKQGEKIIIKPKDTVLITTLEQVDMPENKKISALIQSKVSQVSKGLSHVSTTIDPDWKGRLLIAVHNPSANKIELGKLGETFCTMVFFENKSPSTKGCEKLPGRLDIYLDELSKKYQKAKKREWLKSIVSPGIVFLSLGIGYYIFGNKPGVIAAVAAGVAISQFLEYHIKK